jgi:7-cyano-7-deazaguanine synthase
MYDASDVVALTFDYGQRHSKEMDAASKLAKFYGVKHIIFSVDLTQIGGSALTNPDIEVPEFKADEDVWKTKHVALSYVPMRNTIFIAIASAYAEVLGASEIFTGFNYIDSGGYPDTRRGYVRAMNRVLQIGSRDHPKVMTPLIDMTKAQIVRLGETLGVPWRFTWSCYLGKDRICRVCNACVQRRKGFKEAHVKDPGLMFNEG